VLTVEGLFAKECVTCKKTEDEVLLYKCPICFRFYCDEDRCTMAGREFCSQHCARYFFFPEEDA
jgi:hypothetical protein